MLVYTLLKSIMPVFLAQLLIQFQLKPKTDNATSSIVGDNYETTALPTSTVEITTIPTIMSGSNDDDDDDNILEQIFRYMLFIW